MVSALRAPGQNSISSGVLTTDPSSSQVRVKFASAYTLYVLNSKRLMAGQQSTQPTYHTSMGHSLKIVRDFP